MIAVIPVDLILSIDEATLLDNEGEKLVHQMNRISYIGDHFSKRMISYVVKEGDANTGELTRKCYVFQIDDDQNYDDDNHMIQQVQEIFGTFQQCFKCQQERREQQINKQKYVLEARGEKAICTLGVRT